MERLGLSFLVWLLSGGALAAGAQGGVDIRPDPIECWPIDEFLFVHSLFLPPENLQSAKFYFRSTAYPDYYYVDLALSAGEGSAFVPRAHPDTVEVTFYVELVTLSFDAFRTQERTVPVSSGTECKRRNPAALFFTGQNPNIAVGATRPGATPLPPGFQAEGISSFLDATSGSIEASGGVSGRTIGIIVGVGGGAAAALALSQGGDSGTTTSVVGAVSPSTMISSSTSTAVAGPPSSSTTTTGSGPAPTTSIGTSSTTTTAGGSTSTVGSTSSPTTSNPTTSIATTSNPTTSVRATADMRVTKTGAASATVGQNFNYSITVDNLGPSTADGVRVVDSWTAGLAAFVASSSSLCGAVSASEVQCDLGSMTSAANPITVRLTLRATRAGTLTNSAAVTLASPNDPNSGNNSQSVSTRITALSAGPPAELDLTYRSSIDVEPGTEPTRGQILLNGGSFQATDDAGEYAYTARVREGLNRVETRLDLSAGSSGFWRFDFGAAGEFVTGSLRVESGQVLSQDGSSIVFAVGRGAPPPRFTFEMGEGRRGRPQ